MVLVHAAVRENEYGRTVAVSLVSINAKAFDSLVERCSDVIGYRDNSAFQTFLVQRFNLEHIRLGEDRIFDFQNVAVLGTLLEDIAVLAYVNARVGNDFLADSVKRRISYLCEELVEVVEERRRLLVERRERNITSH